MFKPENLDKKTMARSLVTILEMARNAMENNNGRITKDQCLAIIMQCAVGLGIEPDGPF